MAPRLAIAAVAAALSTLAGAADSFPAIDFGGLGSVAVAGSFSGLQIWNRTSLSAAGSYGASEASLLSLDRNGTIAKLAATSPGGVIHAVCQRDAAPGTVFVGGSFLSINGTAVSNVAAYDPQTQRWDALKGGVDGVVQTLYCDEQHGQVIVGGSFQKAVNTPDAGEAQKYGGAIASWSYAEAKWSPLPFGGVNGTIESITLGSNTSSIHIMGNFDTSIAPAGVNGSASGTLASPSSLSIALSPLPLGQTEFAGGPSSSNRAFSDPAQLLCPKGADGPGNSYLFGDKATGRLTMRTFRSLSTRAIRLGNTFVEGRGTKTFGIVSLPDAIDLTLQYLDPITKQNRTCKGDCTLHHDAAVPFQDFLILDVAENNAPGGSKDLTGIQFTATEWYGDGPGLHSLSLLSDGSAAWAYGGYNRGACSSREPGVNGTASTSLHRGGWTASMATIGGALAPLLSLSDSSANIADNADAQVAWNIDTHYGGNYSVYLYVPGCNALGDCAERTDVLVTVMNNASNPGTSVRISQNVPEDTQVLVYDGQVEKTGPTFMPSVVLSIPTDAPAPSANIFTVYADRVTFFLRNSNETAPMNQQAGFGLLEYAIFNDTEKALRNTLPLLSNDTATPLVRFGATLRTAGVSGNESEFVTSSVGFAGKTFVGGNFTSLNLTETTGFANIVSFEDATNGLNASRLDGGGLNGPVSSLAVVNDKLFIAGNFSATADGKTLINNLAQYDVAANAWGSLAGGPDGPVLSMTPLRETFLLVTGVFETIGNGSLTAGGFAVWDTVANVWTPQESLLIGNVTASSAPFGANDGLSYIAGAIAAASASAASGSAELVAPAKEGTPPTIESLNYSFKSQTTAARSIITSLTSSLITPAAIGAAKSKGHGHGHGASHINTTKRGGVAGATRWLSSALSARNTGYGENAPLSLTRRASAMEPSSLASNGDNEVYASAFWQRAENEFMFVIGGNFTTSTGIRNLAIYDDKADTLLELPPLPASSNLTVVRALVVTDNHLYAGGDGGMQVFDFGTNTWSDSAATLAASGRNVLSVTDIVHRPDTSTVVVAGTFDSAGSLPCKNVCAWDTGSRRWSQLGSGIDGQISALDFAGNKANTLIVAGATTINGAEASLAAWDFDSQTWSALGRVGAGDGQIPGPATAASVDDFNLNAIFVAGRTTDGQEPYLVKWDGSSYITLGNDELLRDSGVAQLSFVGITKAHPGNNIMENNRMLVVSGALNMREYGNVSTALFDGALWTPFLVATTSRGGLGVVRAFTRSTEVLTFPNLKRLAVGIVILISIAIGLGVVFLLVLIGLIWALCRRKTDRGVDVPISPSDDTLAGAGAEKKPPAELLATLNAATEGAMREPYSKEGLGGAGSAGIGAGGAGAAAVAASTSHGHARDSMAQGGTLENSDETGPSTAYHSDAVRSGHSAYYSGEELGNAPSASGAAFAGAGAGAAAGGGAAAAAAAYGGMDEGVEGIEAHARYSFEATHASELAVHAGQTIWILDDQDEHWWLARSEEGTGVIPATYVL